jgi:hypothetical protein
VQTGNQRPRDFKNSKKFLQRAAESAIGVTVYQTPDDLLLTIGGVRYVTPAGNIILGAAMIAAGGSPEGLFDPESTQLIYFESLFDENFEHHNFTGGMLALDHLGVFMASAKNVGQQSVVPFNGYLVLGYYDSKAKQYILRKFQDDDL